MKDDFTTQLNREVGRRIQAERHKAKFSQLDLANRIGLTRTAIIKMENGQQRIPVDQLYRIAQALGVALKDLLPEISDIVDKGSDLIEVAKSRLDQKQRKEIRKLLE